MSLHWYSIRSGDQTFLVDATTIRGVRRGYDAGVATTSLHTVHGRIPLVDLRDMLGPNDQPSPAVQARYMLLVRLVEGWCGIVVDNVNEITTAHPPSPLPPLVQQVGYASLVNGVVLLDDQPVVVLDVHAIIALHLTRAQKTRVIR